MVTSNQDSFLGEAFHQCEFQTFKLVKYNARLKRHIGSVQTRCLAQPRSGLRTLTGISTARPEILAFSEDFPLENVPRLLGPHAPAHASSGQDQLQGAQGRGVWTLWSSTPRTVRYCCQLIPPILSLNNLIKWIYLYTENKKTTIILSKTQLGFGPSMCHSFTMGMI